jgi:hypothetical protein
MKMQKKPRTVNVWENSPFHPHVKKQIGFGMYSRVFYAKEGYQRYLREAYPLYNDFVVKWVYNFSIQSTSKIESERENNPDILFREIELHSFLTSKLADKNVRDVLKIVPMLEWVILMEDPSSRTHVAVTSGKKDTKAYPGKHDGMTRVLAGKILLPDFNQLKISERESPIKKQKKTKDDASRQDDEEDEPNPNEEKDFQFTANSYNMIYEGNIDLCREYIANGYKAVSAYMVLPVFDDTEEHWLEFKNTHPEANLQDPVKELEYRAVLLNEVMDTAIFMYTEYGITHGDLHGGNALIKRESDFTEHIYVSDFGKAEFNPPSAFEEDPDLFYNDIDYMVKYQLAELIRVYIEKHMNPNLKPGTLLKIFDEFGGYEGEPYKYKTLVDMKEQFNVMMGKLLRKLQDNKMNLGKKSRSRRF